MWLPVCAHCCGSDWMITVAHRTGGGGGGLETRRRTPPFKWKELDESVSNALSEFNQVSNCGDVLGGMGITGRGTEPNTASSKAR